jgi:CDGSH-type Zn-finger protein
MSQQLPVISNKGPYKIEVQAGKKYSWCSCGLSANQPFCDGAHKAYKNEDGTSIMKSVSFIADENKTLYFCGCKHSKNPIFCDGTHSKL